MLWAGRALLGHPRAAGDLGASPGQCLGVGSGVGVSPHSWRAGMSQGEKGKLEMRHSLPGGNNTLGFLQIILREGKNPLNCWWFILTSKHTEVGSVCPEVFGGAGGAQPCHSEPGWFWSCSVKEQTPQGWCWCCPSPPWLRRAGTAQSTLGLPWLPFPSSQSCWNPPQCQQPGLLCTEQV